MIYVINEQPHATSIHTFNKLWSKFSKSNIIYFEQVNSETHKVGRLDF